MSQFPRVQELIARLPEDHYAAGLKLSDPIVPALEYFLSLDQVPGFAKKLEELRLKRAGEGTTNDQVVQWASVCAELGGVCLLGRTLGLPILEFDQHSSRAQRANSDCDVVVLVNGSPAYVEIKRRASEDKQSLPKQLEEALIRLEGELPFSLSAELHDRDYDCSDLVARVAAVRRHVEAFQDEQKQGLCSGRARPLPIGGPFWVYFHAKRGSPQRGLPEHFDPDCPETLKPYLLGPAEPGRDGKPKVPMVNQAIAKGADYLLCRVSRWEGWQEIVEGCFGRVTWSGERTCFAPEGCLQGLRGVVLFSRYDDFCIVNDPSAKDGAWLVA